MWKKIYWPLKKEFKNVWSKKCSFKIEKKIQFQMCVWAVARKAKINDTSNCTSILADLFSWKLISRIFFYTFLQIYELIGIKKIELHYVYYYSIVATLAHARFIFYISIFSRLLWRNGILTGKVEFTYFLLVSTQFCH